MEVSDVDFLIRRDDIKRVFVCFSVAHASFNASTCHPHGEGTRVVITTIIGFGQFALRVNRAAEFATEDNEGVIEHASAFEVLDKSVTCLIDVLALRGKIARKIAVLIPSAMEYLCEPNTSFC